jgi:hypothetical protein
MNMNLPKTNFRKDKAQSLIPGAYDRTNLKHRQPGSIGWGSVRFRYAERRPQLDGCGDDRRSCTGSGGGLPGRAWWSRWWSPAVDPDSELLRALQEVVQALDRRKPTEARTGEATIAADSRRTPSRGECPHRPPSGSKPRDDVLAAKALAANQTNHFLWSTRSCTSDRYTTGLSFDASTRTRRKRIGGIIIPDSARKSRSGAPSWQPASASPTTRANGCRWMSKRETPSCSGSTRAGGHCGWHRLSHHERGRRPGIQEGSL